MRAVLTIVLLMFLFWGDPDVFDILVQVTKAWLLKGH